jgi:hypothetical protein
VRSSTSFRYADGGRRAYRVRLRVQLVVPAVVWHDGDLSVARRDFSHRPPADLDRARLPARGARSRVADRAHDSAPAPDDARAATPVTRCADSGVTLAHRVSATPVCWTLPLSPSSDGTSPRCLRSRCVRRRGTRCSVRRFSRAVCCSGFLSPSRPRARRPSRAGRSSCVGSSPRFRATSCRAFSCSPNVLPIRSTSRRRTIPACRYSLIRNARRRDVDRRERRLSVCRSGPHDALVDDAARSPCVCTDTG